MAPEQAKLVQQSCADRRADGKEFYDRLFDVAPSVTATFLTEMTEQRKS